MENIITLNLNNIKAAIFDMDGTMVDNGPFHKKAWKQFLQKHGLVFTEDIFRTQLFGKKNNESLNLLFGKLTDKAIEIYAEEKEQIYRDLYKSHVKEVAGLSEFIQRLKKRGLKVAVATTAPKKNRDFVLKMLHLQNTFDVILGDENVLHGKPNPEIYLSTAKQLNIQPKNCAVFEDSSMGIKAGKNAGMTVVRIAINSAVEMPEIADYSVIDFTHINLFKV